MENNNSEINGVFFFDPKDKIYQDHFPGNPVVPGSVILHSFITASKEAGLFTGEFFIEKFRFRKFVSPGHYPYTVKHEKDRLICQLYDEEEVVVKGNLRI
jgi:3-hydroxyacyl-[acyl-carrier-protein] dehydratase